MQCFQRYCSVCRNTVFRCCHKGSWIASRSLRRSCAKGRQARLWQLGVREKWALQSESRKLQVSDVAEKMDSVAKAAPSAAAEKLEIRGLKRVQAIKEAKTAVDEAQGEEEDTSDPTTATSLPALAICPSPKEALKTAGRAAALAKVAISMWPGLLKLLTPLQV